MGGLTSLRAAIGALTSLLAAAAFAAPAPVFPPLPRPLFDQAFQISGSFGDLRSNHFHAGLDLTTGGVVGWAVHAPADAEVRRVRASGAGYGRSIYLETADGRLLVFGHLDAFAEPVASYVAAVQDSSGQYEQDLWPAAGRMRVRAGEVIGWTGRSGTGGPHLHVEVRRGDMALHPLLAGYTLTDTSTPRIERVTFAPLDDTSFAAGVARPQTLTFGKRDTLVTTGWGRLRVVVEALDAESDGTWDVAPWRVRVTNGAEWVQCEFDSISWATDMSQSDFVYDRGRYTDRGRTSIVLGSPAGFRPRVISASTAEPAEAGVVTLDGSHAVVSLTIQAEDLVGHRSQRVVRIRAQRPEGGAPVRSAVPAEARLTAEGGSAGRMVVAGLGRIEVPKEAVFERTQLSLTRVPRAKSAGDLSAVGIGVRVLPADTPLRGSVEVALVLPRGVAPKRIGLYRDVGEGWDLVGDRFDAATRTIGGGTRHLGRFALFRDTRAPIVKLQVPARQPPAGPYPRWSLEAKLGDGGSGIDARATYFVVDGRRVPSEWDGVVSTLRWRPMRAPKRGHHKVTVIAVDGAGNVRKAHGAFVVD